MKVAYFLTWQHGARTGVFAKVADQVRAWDRLGIEVGIFVATTHEARDDWESLPQAVQVEAFAGVLASVRAQSSLLRRVQAWSPDITYVRTSPRQATASRLLHRSPRVIEIQSDDVAEARLSSLPRRALTLITRRPCHRGACGMVFVSRELAQSSSYSFATDNRIVIGNGIDLGRVPVLPTPASDGPVRLAFIGHPGVPWHGIEEMYALARTRPQWQIDIIGATAPGGARPLGNVVHHGELSADQYVPILANATVGIGTLALYSTGMQEASPLKSREYLARGLPVIGAYEDTDIPADHPVYLRLQNRPGAIVEELPAVERFIDSWRGRRVQHEEIAFLDTSVKESTRIDFLRACARLPH